MGGREDKEQMQGERRQQDPRELLRDIEHLVDEVEWPDRREEVDDRGGHRPDEEDERRCALIPQQGIQADE